jgi:hypothetical protein
MDSKKQLLDFLNHKVFDPILHASPDRFEGADRKALEHVQRATESEKDRYRHYGSAREIRERYLGDLNSKAAKKVNAELTRLKLPKLPDFKDEFLKLCDKLHVDGSSSRTQ